VADGLDLRTMTIILGQTPYEECKVKQALQQMPNSKKFIGGLNPYFPKYAHDYITGEH